jgi:hypothetical protein
VLDGSGVIGSEIYNHNSSLFCFVFFCFVPDLCFGKGWTEGRMGKWMG